MSLFFFSIISFEVYTVVCLARPASQPVSCIRSQTKATICSRSITPPHRVHKTQACTCHMACGLFTLCTKFEEPVAARRRLARSSRALTGDQSTTRRPSLLAAGSAVAQQLLQQFSPHGRQSVARRGSSYPPQAQAEGQQDSTLLAASGDPHGFPVERTDTDEHERQGNVRWAGSSTTGGTDHFSLSTKTAKVFPIQGSGDASACKEVSPPPTSIP